jgi:hypothetical protein
MKSARIGGASTSGMAAGSTATYVEVPLVRLAWRRSAEKDNLFNIAVIARRPEYLPYIRAALTPRG